MGILYLLRNLIKEIEEELRYSLYGKMYLYCEKCSKIVIITPEERKNYGIKFVGDLQRVKCPGCGTTFGDYFYLVDPFE
jgi:transposase-like protein